MPTLVVAIPRITREQIAQVEAIIPGYNQYNPLPLIETEQQANLSAIVFADHTLPSDQFVHSIDEVTETDNG